MPRTISACSPTVATRGLPAIPFGTLAVALCACAPAAPTMSDTVAAGSSPPLPEVVPLGDADPFRYDPGGKRDPFRGWQADGPGPGGDEPRPPSTRFAVADLCLVGITGGTLELALLRDPDGFAFLAGRHDDVVAMAGNTSVFWAVGENWGRIERFEGDRIVVREEFVEPVEGTLLQQDYELLLGACDPDVPGARPPTL